MSERQALTNRPTQIVCELPCPHCGYDLRTMSLAAPCPECGKPCADAIGSFGAAEAQDIADVRRGVRFALAAGAVFPLLLVGLAVIGVSVGWMGRDWPLVVGWLGMALCGPIIATIGVFKFSAPIRWPVLPGVARTPACCPGAALRVLAVAYTVLSASTFACAMIEEFTRPHVEWTEIAGPSLGCLSLAAWCARNVVACRYLARIAALAGGHRLGRMFGIMRRVAAAMLGATLVVGVPAVALMILERQFHVNVLDVRAGFLTPVLDVAAEAFPFVLVGTFVGWLCAWAAALTLLTRGLGRVLRIAAAHGGNIVSAAGDGGADSRGTRVSVEIALAPLEPGGASDLTHGFRLVSCGDHRSSRG